MTEKTLKDFITDEILIALKETFEEVQGIYLDKGTSLFETLATITAEEASQPVSDKCANIAAQVEHITFYLEMLMKFMRGEEPKVDWGEIWRTVGAVTPEEWEACQQRLRETYQRTREFLINEPKWDDTDEVGDGMALVFHTAYHLGEIRQALCTLR